MKKTREPRKPKLIKVKNIDKFHNKDLQDEKFQNGLENALFQQVGGVNVSTVSQLTTMFDSVRWYLLSNVRQLLSEIYVENGVVQTVIDVPVDDALRGGVDIESGELSAEDIQELQIYIERKGDLMKVAQAEKWCQLFGGAAIIPHVRQDPETPFDVESIADDQLEFIVADMWELFSTANYKPQGYEELQKLESDNFYNFYGKKIHKSRVFVMKGKEAPSMIRPRLRGWGVSKIETIVRSINQYIKSVDLSFEVLDEFKLDVYKLKDLVNTLLLPQGESKIQKRVSLANQQKNYQNAIVLDKDDEFDHKQLSFAGLAEVQQGIRMQLACDVRMPLTKIFGISAAGFSSGEDDIENYNAMIESQVRSNLKPIILTILELRCQQLFGFVPEDLKISFKPLRVLSSEQEENVKTQKFNRLIMAVDKGYMTSKEFKDACNKENLLSIQVDSNMERLTPEGSGEGDEGGDQTPVANKKSTTAPKEAKT